MNLNTHKSKVHHELECSAAVPLAASLSLDSGAYYYY